MPPDRRTVSAPELNAIITQRHDIAPGVWVIYVEPDGWALPDFEAGQYATLGLPGTYPRCEGGDAEPLHDPHALITRDYSIASSPLERRHLEFYLVLVGEGPLTPRLYPLLIGDRIWVDRSIKGTFVLSRAPSEANLVFFATGTGVAPYISMLRTLLPRSGTRRIALLHGVRRSADLGYREELQTMDRMNANFHYLPTVSRPQLEPTEWRGRTGHIQEIWKARTLGELWGFEPEPFNTHIYLCGSPAMIDESIGMLRKEGFVQQTDDQEGQIHVEKYW